MSGSGLVECQLVFGDQSPRAGSYRTERGKRLASLFFGGCCCVELSSQPLASGLELVQSPPCGVELATQGGAEIIEVSVLRRRDAHQGFELLRSRARRRVEIPEA